MNKTCEATARSLSASHLQLQCLAFMIKYFNSPPLHSFYMSRSHKSKLAALLLWRRKLLLLLLLFYPLLSTVAHEVKSVDLQTRKTEKKIDPPFSGQ